MIKTPVLTREWVEKFIEPVGDGNSLTTGSIQASGDISCGGRMKRERENEEGYSL